MKKVGVWGAGFISHSHAAALRKCGIDILAVVDQSEQAVKTFASKWNIPTYGTDDSILFSDTITTVHVCTPPNMHFKMVKRLLESGKNVLCEKPLCFTNNEAEELVKLAISKSLKCAVNLNVRYHNMTDKIKEKVQSSNFGDIHLIHGNYLQEFHTLPTAYNWRYKPELAGKMRAVTEIGTHWFDIIKYVSNLDIVSVSALFGNYSPKRLLKDNLMYSIEEKGIGADSEVEVASEDVALVYLRFSNGAIGSVVLSEISHGYSNHLSYEITGSKMTVGWNSQDNNEFYFSEGQCQSNIIKDGFGNGFNDSFQNLVTDFYSDSMESLKYPSFKEGAAIVKICNAIYKSATNESEWVSIE